MIRAFRFWVVMSCLPVWANGEWVGHSESLDERSGYSAAVASAYDAAARHLGEILAREAGAPQGRAAVDIAFIWLERQSEALVRKVSSSNGVYTCVLTLQKDLPKLRNLRRELLAEDVLKSRAIHPLVLMELSEDDDDRDDVIDAFVARLDSPVAVNYFLSGEVTDFAPRENLTFANYPKLAAELSPQMLIRLMAKLPGHPTLCAELANKAQETGRPHMAEWVRSLPVVSLGKPLSIERKMPYIMSRVRNVRDANLVTPGLRRLYATRHLCPCGSRRVPRDDSFASAKSLESAGLYYEAYGAYLQSADASLSYEASLGAAKAASHVREFSEEAILFYAQAAILAPNFPESWIGLAECVAGDLGPHEPLEDTLANDMRYLLRKAKKALQKHPNAAFQVRYDALFARCNENQKEEEKPKKGDTDT